MEPSENEPPWLDDAEMDAWLALTTMLIRLPAALDAQLRRDAAISHFEYMVLATLSDTDGAELPMSRLAALADGSLSRLSHCVKRLEDAGWVRRSQHPTNGRVTMAALTPAGRDKVEHTAPGHVRAVRDHVFEPLSDRQVIELRRIAQRINATIPAELGPPTPPPPP
ncbi:MAG: MarR family winged helix-turn-helix transcriptional regulator [Desertimonas sp.]